MDLTENADKPAKIEAAPKEAQGKSIKPSKLFVEYYGSVVLLLIAILVGAGFLVIKPKLDDWKSMRSQTVATREQAENDRQYYEGLSRSVAASQGISPDVLAKLDRALPREPFISEMIVELEGMAAANGVRIGSVAFESGKTVNVSGLQSLNLNLVLEAKDYQSMKDFLAALEKNLRLTETQNISFSSTEKGNTTFTLTAKVFYYPIGPQAAAPAAGTEQPPTQ